MSLPESEPLRIETTRPAERQSALALVVSQLPEADRQRQIAALLSADGVAKTSLDGLVGGYRGKRMVGAGLAQVMPGKTAAVWPPRLVAGEPPVTAVQILDRLVEFLAARKSPHGAELVGCRGAGG